MIDTIFDTFYFFPLIEFFAEVDLGDLIAPLILSYTVKALARLILIPIFWDSHLMPSGEIPGQGCFNSYLFWFILIKAIVDFLRISFEVLILVTN